MFETMIQRVKQAETVSYTGKIENIVGMSIEASGGRAAIGDICRIYSGESGGQVLAEVVGFKNDNILLMPYANMDGISAGNFVRNTGRRLSLLAGPFLKGRVINALGQPIDGGEPFRGGTSFCVENAGSINPFTRPPIRKRMEFGVRAIDGMLTIGKGQRIGIFAGSGVGKSTLMGMIAKHVKADITVINFVGGLITGILIDGGDLATVLHTYTTATIGDGLVSELPALMISTATGMIVTRSVSDGSLNLDVIHQFKNQPRAILSTGVIILLLAVFPGTPTLPLLAVGALLAAGGVWISRKMSQEAQNEEKTAEPALESRPATESDYFKDINHVYDLLAVEPIEMEFGYSLIPLVDEASGGKLISRIVIFRRQYAQEMGFVIPSIRLHDGAGLGTNQYVIKIRGEEVARGEILVDYYLALEPANPSGEIDGIETVEPAYGIPSRWILPENKEMAEIYGYTVITPLTVMLTHLSETIKKHTYELLNRTETIQLVENLKKSEPELVADAVPTVISYANLEKILRSLLREGIPIRDLETILETAVDAWGNTHDLDMVTEQIRGALSRTITRKFCENGQLRVVTIDAEMEKKVLSSLTKSDHGVYLALSPDIMQQIVNQLGELRKKFNELSQAPILLTSQIIRVYLSRLISQFYPDVYVLSFNEITSQVQIQAIGNITLDQK